MAHIDIGQDSVLNLYRDVEVTAGLELVFSNDTQRYNYFNKRLVKQYTGLSYVYRNGVIKIQETPQVVAQCNFISFNNPSFESKPIYARIVDYRYVNNATVEVTYSVDYWITFMFDVDFRSCQIMREHLSEADWQKALANPWRHDILELETGENFNFDEDARPYINTTTDEFYLEAPSGKDSKNYVMLALSPFSYSRKEGDTGTPEQDFYSLTSIFRKLTPAILESGEFHQVVVEPGQLTDGIPDPFYLYIFEIDGEYMSTFDTGWFGESTAGHKKLLDGFMDDLTAMSRTSQIIALYYVPTMTVRAVLGDTSTAGNIVTASIQNRVNGGVNPKLKRFPYSYLAVESPAGNIKEFKYEKFTNPADGIDFYFMGNYNGFPFVSLVPFNYGYGNPGAVYYGGSAFNITERLDYTEAPQLGYTTDGFLSYLSSQYQQAQANQSTPAQLARMGQFVAGGASVLASMAPTIAGAALPSLTSAASLEGTAPLSAMGNMANTISQGQNQPLGALAGAGMMMDAIGKNFKEANIRSMMGHDTFLGSPMYDYSTEKGLYDNDIYHAGTAGGYPAYSLGRFYFRFYFKTLTPAWIEICDNYFNAFGYNSGRIGIPRVCNVVKGSGDMPHFATWDGDPCTYVQTADMRVISSMKPASDYIEAIFNSGHRFIKGDGR